VGAPARSRRGRRPAASPRRPAYLQDDAAEEVADDRRSKLWVASGRGGPAGVQLASASTKLLAMRRRLIANG
jgi:hypothetical protein